MRMPELKYKSLKFTILNRIFVIRLGHSEVFSEYTFSIHTFKVN